MVDVTLLRTSIDEIRSRAPTLDESTAGSRRTTSNFVAYNVRSAYGDRQKPTPEKIDRYHALLMRDGNREAAHRVIRQLRPE